MTSQRAGRAGIIAVGDELVLGQKLNTNSQWLAAWLMDRGVRTVEHVTCDDDTAQIAAAINRLADHASLIIITGGLGPTLDDLTRNALAAVLNQPLVEDPAALAHVRDWFESRRIAMPETNRIQALRPESARALPNHHGTAFGLSAELPGGATVLCLPGPPHEMRPMAERELAPRIDRLVAQGMPVVQTRVLQTFGLGESTIAQRLDALMNRGGTTTVGTTASTGVVSIRIRSEGAATQDEAAAAIDATERDIRARLGPAIFGEDETTLEEAVLAALRERSHTLAVVESCTGGMLGEIITSVPGSSDAFAGGWITYTNALKAQQVGVPQEVFTEVGAVSSECAIAMAIGGRERSGADWTLAITGIAGPDGGTEFKPVGTVWIALAGPDGPHARQFRFKGNRDQVRLWSARSALGMLRLALLKESMTLVGQLVD